MDSNGKGHTGDRYHFIFPSTFSHQFTLPTSYASTTTCVCCYLPILLLHASSIACTILQGVSHTYTASHLYCHCMPLSSHMILLLMCASVTTCTISQHTSASATCVFCWSSLLPLYASATISIQDFSPLLLCVLLPLLI